MPDWRKLVRERVALPDPDRIEEIAQHLEDRYRELRSGGASEQEACRLAASELDDLYPMRDEMKRSQRMARHDEIPAGDIRAGNFFDDTWRDLRYTFRTMRQNPLFVGFVVLTLGLGIGANATVFTVVNTLILNPLPVQDASHLAAIATAETKNISTSSAALPISYANLKDIQSKNEVFESTAGYTSPRIVTRQTGEASQRMFAEPVTGNYFATLGLTPAKGRFFLPEEDGAPGRYPVAVLNHATWQAHFGAADDIVGKTLRINSVVFTIIGVAPPAFIGISPVFGPDLWIPAAMAEQLLPGEMHGALTERSKAVFQGIARLKPSVSFTQAQANVTAIASALQHEYPEANAGRTASVQSIREVFFGAGSGRSMLFGSVLLFVVVGIVLLIACSNVANLLLARSAARKQEIAVRLAMGASRGRLVRQLLTESVFLGLLSGVVGVAIGYAGSQLLWSFRPAEVSANLIAPRLDATVFVFTLILSLLTGFVFGTIPALRATRMSVSDTLKEEGRSTGRSRSRITFANALLVGQVAFSFVSLVTAALFLRSIERAYQIDPGFQANHLAIFMTNPGQAGYGKPQTKALYKTVRERVAGLPGVESASWATNLPLFGRIESGLQVEGRQQRSKTDGITAVVNTVDLNYFGTAGVAIEKGREFTAMDQESSTPVAIVNAKMAHDYWPTGDALGKRIQLPGESAMRQVIGVARMANYSSLGEQPQLCVYVPLEQNYSDAMTLYVRTKGDPQQILIPVQSEVRGAAQQISMDDARTGRKILDQALFGARIGVALLSVFGLLALGLASIGLYGIMAYSVNRRKREIGVRMALGASQKSVTRLILRQGMSLVVAGVAIGLAAALVAGRLLAGMLYGVSTSDPISVFSAALVLLAVAMLACYLPARWASRVDPLVALREG